jgi:hypothetical protein
MECYEGNDNLLIAKFVNNKRFPLNLVTANTLFKYTQNYLQYMTLINEETKAYFILSFINLSY